MPIRFNCSWCRALLIVEDQHGGRTARCPGCHKQVPVPASPPATPAAKLLMVVALFAVMLAVPVAVLWTALDISPPKGSHVLLVAGRGAFAQHHGLLFLVRMGDVPDSTEGIGSRAEEA